MRRIGLLTNKAAADQFSQSLRSRGLEARRNELADGSEFWLFDEDRLDEVRSDLERHQRGDYVPVPLAPPAPPERTSPVREVARPSYVRRLLSPAPWTVFICLASIVATLATGFFQVPTRFSRDLAIIPLNVSAKGATYSPADDDPFHWAAQGEVWRLFTPALLHAHFLHLLLNLQWFYFCGSVVERIRGTWRIAGLTIVSAVVSNLCQYWWNGPYFCGLSGVGYALYGYVWMKSLFQPETRFVIPRSLHTMFWIWTIICFSGLLPIANAAHAGGLAVGILYGLVKIL
jgi:GlpG protein